MAMPAPGILSAQAVGGMAGVHERWAAMARAQWHRFVMRIGLRAFREVVLALTADRTTRLQHRQKKPASP